MEALNKERKYKRIRDKHDHIRVILPSMDKLTFFKLSHYCDSLSTTRFQKDVALRFPYKGRTSKRGVNLTSCSLKRYPTEGLEFDQH